MTTRVAIDAVELGERVDRGRDVLERARPAAALLADAPVLDVPDGEARGAARSRASGVISVRSQPHRQKPPWIRTTAATARSPRRQVQVADLVGVIAVGDLRAGGNLVRRDDSVLNQHKIAAASAKGAQMRTCRWRNRLVLNQHKVSRLRRAAGDGVRAPRAACRCRRRCCRSARRRAGSSSRSEQTMCSSASEATSAAASVERTQTSGPRRAGSAGVTTSAPSSSRPAISRVLSAAHVRLDRRHARLLEQAEPGDARVDVRHRRRARVEAARGRVRRVVGDVHLEDVLVGEPAGLGRHQRLRAPRAAPRGSRGPAEASRYFTVPPVTKSAPSARTSSSIAPAAW